MAVSLSVAEFIDGPWRVACYNRRKPSTRLRVDSALAGQVLPTFGKLQLTEVSPVDVHQWFEQYSRTAPGGANRTLDILKQIFNHAIRCGYASRNPARGIRPNPRARLTRFLSTTEVTRLYDALRTHQGRGSGRQQADIIRLLLLTGCRKSEVINLRWSEVTIGTIHLPDSKTGTRSVLLNRPAREILSRQTRGASEFVFPCLRDPTRPRSAELSLWRKVRRVAGLNDVRLHDLRHTFASHAALARVPLPVVARLLGHRKERMTFRYAHVSDRETESAAERIGQGLNSLLDGPRTRA